MDVAVRAPPLSLQARMHIVNTSFQSPTRESGGQANPTISIAGICLLMSMMRLPSNQFLPTTSGQRIRQKPLSQIPESHVLKALR